jgi:hypothetical protein
LSILWSLLIFPIRILGYKLFLIDDERQLQALKQKFTPHSSIINNNEAFIFNNRNSGTTYQVDFRTLGTERGSINVTDSGTSYATTSDYRVKEDFKD